MDLQELRDIVVIAAVSALSVWGAALVLIYAFISYKTWRGIRRLNRLSEQQLRDRLQAFNTRWDEWEEEGVFTPSGLAGLAFGGVRWLREKRRPKKKRRFAFLRDLGIPGSR
jgi:hypothetical protein